MALVSPILRIVDQAIRDGDSAGGGFRNRVIGVREHRAAYWACGGVNEQLSLSHDKIIRVVGTPHNVYGDIEAGVRKVICQNS